MTKQAQLPDGTILEFPDETPDAVMDKAVKSHLGQPDFSNVKAGAGKPRQMGVLDALKREAGLGARGIIRGAYDLTSLFGGDIINAAESEIRGVPVRSQRENADWLADTLGLPSPQTTTERVGGDITAGLTGGGGLLGLGRQMAVRAPGVVSRVGTMLAAQPGLQVTSNVAGTTAASSAREMGASPGVQTIAGLAAGMAPSAGAASGAGLLRLTVRGGEQGRQNMERTIADFARVGATPSVGQASGNRVVQGAESLLSGAPTSAGVLGRFAERQMDNIGEGLQARADGFVPNASAERAGRAVERGAKTFAGDVAKQRAALYSQADVHIPPTTVVPLARTRQVLAELTTVPAGAQATGAQMVNPHIRSLAERIDRDFFASRTAGSMGSLAPSAGGLGYQTVRDIRTMIGRDLSDFSLSSDRPTRQLKRVYAALSDDLEETARRQGPAATLAMRRANTYFRASAERLDQLERLIDKNGGPERIYAAVMSGTKDGGTTLRAVMQSLPQDGQRALTAAVIKRMGLATPGQQSAAGEAFSAQTFLTNWNGVSREAKRALFDRHGPKFVADMDKIARVAENIRNGSRVYANPSGTANKAAAYTYWVSLSGALLTGQLHAAAGLGVAGTGANAFARALTNPRFVNWLAKGTELPPSAITQQMVALRPIAASDPDVAEWLEKSNEQPSDAATQ